MPAHPPFLSIIIPAFNEEARLPKSLDQLRVFLSSVPWTAEVVVVDDGSVDRTAAIVQERRRDWPELQLVEGPHQGKGAAVKAGVLSATGRYVALADADFAMPVAEFLRFLAPLSDGYPIVIGSREVAGAQRFHEPRYRHFMGRVFNGLVQLLLLPGIKDTQCGFKVLRREEAGALCQQQTLNCWGFDVELLVIARQFGYRIAEVGIPWYYMSGSRINPIRDTVTMFGDIMRIRRNLRKRVYAQTPLPGASPNEVVALPVHATVADAQSEPMNG